MKARAEANKLRLLSNYTKKKGTESLRMLITHRATSEDKAHIKAQMVDLPSGQSLRLSLRKQLESNTRNLLWAAVNLTTRIISETRRWILPCNNKIEKSVSLVRNLRKTISNDYLLNCNLDLKSLEHQKVDKDPSLVNKTFLSNSRKPFQKLRGK